MVMRKTKKDRFSARLKEMRKHVKITQKELAHTIGIDPSSIGNYEAGHRKPDYETLTKIADYFGVSIDWLLGRTNNPQMSTIEIAVKGMDPRIQKIILEDKDNALPFLELAADCLDSGYPAEHIKEILNNIFAVRRKLNEIEGTK